MKTMRIGAFRRMLRGRIADEVLAARALGLTGRELAIAVEHACPYPHRSWGHRVWQRERCSLAGRLRRAAAAAAIEYPGLLPLAPRPAGRP